MNKRLIFASSTPRSGGTLLTNILSLHPQVIITKDLIHFFRYIYKKYNPIQNKRSVYLLVHELCLRLKFRNNIKIKPSSLLKNILKKKINYKNIYLCISQIILQETNKLVFGENANSEWHNIENFLNLDKNFFAYQGIRDPRAVMMSWKNVTYESEYKYLIIIFYWLDAIQHMEKNLKQFKRRFCYVKFEDIHIKPYQTISTLYDFLGLDFKKKYFLSSNFKKQKKNPFIHINVSANTNKPVIAFSKARTTNWKNQIESWEIALVQHILGKYMKKYGYKLLRTKTSDLKMGLDKLKSDKLLNKVYHDFKKFDKIILCKYINF